MMVDRLLKSTPRWQVNRVQIRANRWTKNVWLSELKILTLQVCVSGGVRGSTVLLQ